MVAARRRRRRRPRWLVLLLLLTAVVLVINAAASSRSHGPAQRLAELSYVDQMRPLVERSTQDGADLADAEGNAGKLGRDGIDRRLTQVAKDAASVLSAVEGVAPPASLKTAHSLLVSTMYIRAQQAAAMKGALIAALGGDPAGPAVDVLVTAGADLVTSDRTYDVFRRALPAMRGGTARLLPPSHWIDDPTGWSGPALTAYVQSVRASTTLTPVHDVSVVLVSIDPPAVGSDAGSMVLPPTKTLHMQIVVADVGNEAEKRVPVLATLTTSTGAAETVHDMVDLAPGQRTTVILGGLHTVADDRSTLTVSVGPVPGETATPDNTKVIPLVVKPG